GVTEQVVVEGASSIVQTQSSAAANTITTKQIGSLPLGSRDTLQFVTFLPGVNTPAGNRDSSVNGLPQSSINITIDGVSVQDNYLKSSDGFFARSRSGSRHGRAATCSPAAATTTTSPTS